MSTVASRRPRAIIRNSGSAGAGLVRDNPCYREPFTAWLTFSIDCENACGPNWISCEASTSLSLFCYNKVDLNQTCCGNGSGRGSTPPAELNYTGPDEADSTDRRL